MERADKVRDYFVFFNMHMADFPVFGTCRLMLTYIESRRHYNALNDQLKTLIATRSGQRIPHMSDNTRKALERNIEETSQNLGAEKQKQDKALSDIMALDFWPARRPRPPTKEEEERDLQAELEMRNLLPRVERMVGTVQQLEQQLKGIQGRVEPNETSSAAGVGGTVDRERDRIEAAHSGSPVAGSSKTGSSQHDLQNLRHRITQLEGSIDDLRNESVVERDNLDAEIEATIEKRLEDSRFSKIDTEKFREELEELGKELKESADLAADHICKTNDEMTEVKTTLGRIKKEHGEVSGVEPLNVIF